MFRHIKYFIIILALCTFIYPIQANSATITALSPSLSDVQTAISSASSGDIVIVPAGSALWSSPLSITKGITLTGAGIDQTTITSSSGSQIVLYKPAIPASNETFRLTGFTLNGNNRAVTGVYVANTSTTDILTKIRIDHNKIINTAVGGQAIYVLGMVYGLIDNNTITANDISFRILGLDNYSWNDPIALGTSSFLYIEDNTIAGPGDETILSGWGGRWIFRYNTVNLANLGCATLDAHGNMTALGPGATRGVVGTEIYENTFTNSEPVKLMDIRGGTCMMFNNAVTGSATKGNVIIEMREEDDDPTFQFKLNHLGYDPIINTYIWNNTNNGDIIYNVDSDATMLIEKTDYWRDGKNWSSDPSGYFTSGLSSGRGDICSDDDCYWETDTKKLYRCVVPDNWIFIYTPYIYPHPLNKPSPPQNLRIK